MEKIYNVTDFAEMIGKSVKTLQRWDRDGVLVAYRSPSNRRYYTHAQYLEYLGQLNNSDGVNVAYARAFSKNQAEYLEDQLNLLRSYSTREGIPISVVYTDYGSGLNFRRKEWNKLIEDCIAGKIKRIYVTDQDRFMTIGYDWMYDLLKNFYGVNIIPIGDIFQRSKGEATLEFLNVVEFYSQKNEKLNKMKYKIREKLLKEE